MVVELISFKFFRGIPGLDVVVWTLEQNRSVEVEAGDGSWWVAKNTAAYHIQLYNVDWRCFLLPAWVGHVIRAIKVACILWEHCNDAVLSIKFAAR